MNWEAIGAIGEVVGSLAVIASLLYLAIQVRSNSAIARAESQRELLDITPIMGMTASNPALVRTIQAALTDFDQLSKADQAQFHSWAHVLCAKIESAFRMHQAGMMEEASFIAYRRAFLGFIDTKGGARWWEVTQGLWPIDFAKDINSSRETEKSEIVSWSVTMPFFTAQDSAS